MCYLHDNVFSRKGGTQLTAVIKKKKFFFSFQVTGATGGGAPRRWSGRALPYPVELRSHPQTVAVVVNV
jgi:hypothetical protein